MQVFHWKETELCIAQFVFRQYSVRLSRNELSRKYHSVRVKPKTLSTRLYYLRAAAHQLRQDKHQDMRQKTQSCFIRDSDWSPHTEVARVCVLSHLL
jgi:hypothetical protein